MHLHNNNCVLPTNNHKLIVLNILPLLRLVRSDMVDIMWVLKDYKNGHFVVKLIILCDSFCYSRPCAYPRVDDIHVGGALLKQWTSMETPRSGSFQKGKKTKNSLPNVSLINQHSTTSNPLSSFPITSFVKIFFFFSTFIFSFFCFFC
jgi:hypothetical protein